MKLPDEALASFSICILLTLLIVAMLLGYLLRQWGISYVQEAGVALVLGVGAGLLVQYLSGDQSEQKWFTFQPRFFFLFLLPPIIFDSGFGLNMKAFFRNFVSICTFAFFGTFVSAVVSDATDPVTVLAIFHSLKVEPKMYSLVFGESVLNDAVAIVLYKTLVSFKGKTVSVKSCGLAVGQFLTIFVGSFTVGIVVALVSSLLFKKASFARAKNTDTTLQVAIAVLFPYCAYMIAEGLTLSGIVAILFTGVTMAHYTLKNLGAEASAQLKSFFRVLASLAETFIFIYIGEEMFLANQTWRHISLTGVAFGAVLISRVFNIFPGAWILNLFTKRPEKKIPFTYQKMLWFSGLRGGIAFALALETFKDIPEAHAQAILNATLLIIVFTVIVNGGLTVAALKSLKIQMGYIESNRKSYGEINFSGVGAEDSGNRRISDAKRSKVKSMESIVKLQAYIKAWKYNSSFEVLDRKYLMPFFTLQTEYGNGSRGYSKMAMDVELTDQGKEENDDGGEGGGETAFSGEDNQLEMEGSDEDVEITLSSQHSLRLVPSRDLPKADLAEGAEAAAEP
ncbi:sodium/hydrogen exchanger [Chloropicon roscoffensis]|uniref:Sodium/hydrogen exchanger n=1 Tax=Chloropicon roscoffensis TaxID=1461544 RepID=A0AAX4PLI4_9CHLO